MVGFKWNIHYITYDLTVACVIFNWLVYPFIEKWPSSDLETPGTLVPIRDTDTHPWCSSVSKVDQRSSLAYILFQNEGETCSTGMYISLIGYSVSHTTKICLCYLHVGPQ